MISGITGGASAALIGYQSLQSSRASTTQSLIQQTYGQNFPTESKELSQAKANQALLQPQVNTTLTSGSDFPPTESASTESTSTTTTSSSTRGTTVDISV